ncbi:MAG: ThuA domain-containing protein [Alphaproteobacteria bacterium]|nr:ThuA domain-containing protein [Alphaproteobacteria bacterium]
MSHPRILIWNEFRHERTTEAVRRLYPDGIHEALAAPLRTAGFPVATATLEQPEQGLSEAALAGADVLIWWGHAAHGEVADEAVERVHRHVLGGLGLIVLHSAHYSKIFRRLMGTTCSLGWRVDGARERLWVVAPAHPIAEGLGPHFEIAAEEMYSEFFDIPEPDELVLVSWFKGGEVFRSGCAWRRGFGRVFYFRPGHETFPTYHQAPVQRVIANAVRWAAQAGRREAAPDNRRCAPLEA